MEKALIRRYAPPSPGGRRMQCPLSPWERVRVRAII